ncbi:MAG: hypothetical protein RSA17_06410 [Ruthenibacterium sp.]
MITESIAISAIALCLMFLFVRGKHPDYAISVSPILLVPIIHLTALLALRAADGFLPTVPYQMMVAWADMAALAVSCALFVTFSVKIKSKKTKRLYIMLMVGYSVLLTGAYVYQTLEPLASAYLASFGGR